MRSPRPEPGTAESRARTRGKLPGTARSIPDIEAMRRWLVSDAMVSAEGAILSWANPRHPGYAYPESAGLFLSALSTQADLSPEARQAADRVASWLCASIDTNGSVGRGGIAYLFDSAVALAGLLRYRARGGSRDVEEPVRRLRSFVGEHIGVAAAVRPLSAAADGRWSTQFGAHLVKCLHGLHLYARDLGEDLADDLVAALVNRAGQQPSPVYLHPFCYEQEGHLVVAHYGLGSLFEPIEGALDWLVALQQPDGAILAYANGMDGFGEARSDATAQAVRLWLVGDRSRYGEAISRALAFLARCQTAEGGIRYAPSSDDVCSWSTMFTLQAVEWFLDGPRIDQLL